MEKRNVGILEGCKVKDAGSRTKNGIMEKRKKTTPKT
jgi:hypothetical protein